MKPTGNTSKAKTTPAAPSYTAGKHGGTNNINSETKQPQRNRGKHSTNRLFIELTPQQRLEMRKAFDLFDAEGTGRIPASEIKVTLRALGFEVKKEELKSLLAEVGITNPTTGVMDFNEYLRVVLHKVCEKESKDEVTRMFKMFDEHDKGFITLNDLEQIVETLNLEMTEDELREMIMFAGGGTGSDSFAGSGGLRGQNGIGSGPSGISREGITEEDFMKLMRRASVY